MLCDSKTERGLLLCPACFRNPFYVEDIRKILSVKNDKRNFLQTYKSPYSEIQNKNTGTFWDKKFTNEQLLTQQDGMTKDKIKTISQLIPKGSNKILDLGIGQAYLEEQLTISGRNKYDIYGIDISKKTIDRLKKKYTGNFIVGDILEIDKKYEGIKFDVIVAIEVIEHISPKKILIFFKKVNSLLKRGGTFIISTPLNEGLRYMKINPSEHVREYTIPTLEMELKLSGFSIETIKTFTAFQNHYFLKKQISKFIHKWNPNGVVIKTLKP